MSAAPKMDDIDSFLKRVEKASSAVRGIVDGSIDPDDPEVVRMTDGKGDDSDDSDGMDIRVVAESTLKQQRAAARAREPEEAKRERERLDALTLWHKWSKDAADERDRWWRFARLQVDAARSRQEDAAADEAEDGSGATAAAASATSAASAAAAQPMRVRVVTGDGQATALGPDGKPVSRGIDYSKWDRWLENPDDPATKAEQEAARRAKEEAQDRAFEANNPDFCNSFMADMRRRNRDKERRRQAALGQKASGNAFFGAGEFDAAAGLYLEALRELPMEVALLTNLAQAHLSAGRLADAVEFADRALFLQPENLKALFRRAAARQRQGKHELAVRDLEAAHELEPDNEDILAALARARTAAEESRAAAALQADVDHVRARGGAHRVAAADAGAAAAAPAGAGCDGASPPPAAAAAAAVVAAVAAPPPAAAAAAAAATGTTLPDAPPTSAADVCAELLRATARSGPTLSTAGLDARICALISAIADPEDGTRVSLLVRSTGVAAAVTRGVQQALDGTARPASLAIATDDGGGVLRNALLLLAAAAAEVQGTRDDLVDSGLVATVATRILADDTRAASAGSLPVVAAACTLLDVAARGSEGRAALRARCGAHAPVLIRGLPAAVAWGARALASDAARDTAAVEAIEGAAGLIEQLADPKAPARVVASVLAGFLADTTSGGDDGAGGGGAGGEEGAAAEVSAPVARVALVLSRALAVCVGRGLLVDASLPTSGCTQRIVGALVALVSHEAFRPFLAAPLRPPGAPRVARAGAGPAPPPLAQPLLDVLRLPVPSAADRDQHRGWTTVVASALAALANAGLKTPAVSEALVRAGAPATILTLLGRRAPLAVRARGAALLSRLASTDGAVPALASHVKDLGALLAGAAAGDASAAADVATLEDSAVRCLAASLASASAAADFRAAGVLRALATLFTRLAASQELTRARAVALGNAARCISALQRLGEPAARAADAELALRTGLLDGLVGALRHVGSHPARKNMAIALALLAKHPPCQARMRENRGMEILISLRGELSL